MKLTGLAFAERIEVNYRLIIPREVEDKSLTSVTLSKELALGAENGEQGPL